MVNTFSRPAGHTEQYGPDEWDGHQAKQVPLCRVLLLYFLGRLLGSLEGC